MTPTRSATDLQGTQAVPAGVAHGAADVVGTLDLSAGTPPPADGEIGVVVTMPAPAPTANCTLTFSYSFNGTDFLDDGAGPIALVLTANSVTAYGPYPAPPAAKAIRATLHNGDAANDFNAWVAGGTVTYS